MSGLDLAARYSLRPHELGFCGPQIARRQQILKKFIRGEASAAKTRKALKDFKGAYHYYGLIAKSNKIKNPFDEKVVAAYWIGNSLLEKVKTEDLREMIIKYFSGKGLLPKEIAVKKAAAIPENSKPHHSFHVLVIGSVTGSVDFKNTKLKDLCRIGWGRVTKKFKVLPLRGISRREKSSPPTGDLPKGEKFKVIVTCQPLVGKKKIRLGRPVKREIIWDREIVPKVKIGDWVSFHWNWLVQVLTKKEVKNLRKYTLKTLQNY